MKDFFDHKLPTDTRKFFDPTITQAWVKENAQEAFEHKLNKIESADYKLRVTNVGFDKETVRINNRKTGKILKYSVSLPTIFFR